jgi:rhodanese-related sulfurtransferase
MKTNQILALLAILGGFTAAFTSFSVKNDLYPTWKYESERVKGGKISYISAPHLADILYRKDQIVLLDLRAEDVYRTYHIPTALPFDKLDRNGDTKKISYVVYGREQDVEGQELPEGLSGRIYVLKGGLEAWQTQVLFPDFAKYKVRNREALEHIIRRSKYFGGSPGNTQLLNIEQRQSSYREGC